VFDRELFALSTQIRPKSLPDIAGAGLAWPARRRWSGHRVDEVSHNAPREIMEA